MLNLFRVEATPYQEAEPRQRHDEFEVLMSMALDDLLDVDERERLEHHVQACTSCRHQWDLWQAIDQRFRMAPVALPPVDFVERFEARLERGEARRTLRVGIFLAVLTLMLWMVGIVGVGLVLGYLALNDVGWFGQTFHWLAYGWTLLQVMGQSVWQVLVGLSAHPSAVAGACGYILLAVITLIGWTYFLRRSTHPLDVHSL